MQCQEGHTIPPDGPGDLCPRCLTEMVDEELSPPSRIGPFTLLERLGEGGFGIVYRARRLAATEDVALKIPRVEFNDARSLAEFRREAALSLRLEAKHVVQVREVGETAGAPYFTMEFMQGGPLRARVAGYRAAPRDAVQLMIRIANAVQYLHHDPDHPEREPILHRDLKPENVLFDGEGNPKLSDFGIAKVAKGPTWTHATRPVGCPAYMAPEQAFPSNRRELTAAADVYALGAILYELLTGRPPFDGEPEEILSQLRDAAAVPRPRRFVPELDRRIEGVVLSALEKDPAFRYRSAAGFAQDLALALLEKDREHAPPLPAFERLRRWIWYHPLRAAIGSWGIALALGLFIGWLNQAKQLAQAQQTNASIAGMQAVAVSLQLKAYKQRIAELARDPEVVALLASENASTPPPVLLARLAPFDTMFVMGPSGRQVARTTRKPAEYLARSFAFRDYFKGAQALAPELCREGGVAPSTTDPRGAHLARAFQSESDGHFEFALSAPLCRGGTWVGVFGGTIGSDHMLGAVRLLDDGHGRTTAVLGPRDRERSAAHLPLPEDLAFIVHPGLVKGQAQQLLTPNPLTVRRELGLSSSALRSEAVDRLRYAAPYAVDDYSDPTPGYEGRWSAVFAAADESGYVVAVASRRSSSLLLDAFTSPAGVPYGLGLLVLAAISLRQLRRASAAI